MSLHPTLKGGFGGGYDPDEPQPLDDTDAEQLLILLHRYSHHPDTLTPDEPLNLIVEALAMSMDPTTDLADRIRRDLGA